MCFLIMIGLLDSPRVLLQASVLRVLRGYKVTCSATGTPPIHTALIRNSTVLVNTTNAASIRVYEEGNFNCVATSIYGTDAKEILVILTGKILHTFGHYLLVISPRTQTLIASAFSATGNYLLVKLVRPDNI